MTLDEALAECPVVAILRGVRPEEVLSVAGALFDAGMRAIEVPLNSPQPLESLRRLTEVFRGRMVCGAGTVLTPEEVYEVGEAGGRIIVSPNAQVAVIRRAVGLGLDPIAGFATAGEAFTALSAGARHLKLFPASTYGPAHVSQLLSVLPARAVIWAVGGVGAADLADWWAAGARAFGVGAQIYRPGQNAEETRGRAEAFVTAARALSA